MSRVDARIDRLGSNDLATLASDRGPAPFNIAALLVLDGGSELRFETVRDTLESRLPAVPRLRQRLRVLPPGLGRPIWVDDAAFDIGEHVRDLDPLDAGPGDRGRAVLDVVAGLACEPLSRDRALWRAGWVQELGAGRAGLVIVLHHVVADGLGGLAALAALADPPQADPPQDVDRIADPPRDSARPVGQPVPSGAALAWDAWRSRARALRRTGAAVSTIRAGLRELDVTTHAPQLVTLTGINRPTGPRRVISVAAVPLDVVVDTAHAHGATVNDVVLVGVGGALGTALARRHQSVPELVVSVPVSARRGATPAQLGNQTGVRPLRVPTGGDPLERLALVAEASKASAARAGAGRATSAAPLLGVFRGLARLGLLRWFVEHQRLVHTFVTNVRGPAEPLRLLDRRIADIVPVAISPGNVGVTFDVLSYAGRLVVTVVADPAIVPDHEQVAEDIRCEILALTGTPT